MAIRLDETEMTTLMLNETEMQEIEKRCEAATPGPWKTINYWNVYTSPKDGIGVMVASTEHTGGDREEEAINADFIAHARQDIPALLSTVRELQRQVKDMEEHSRLALARTSPAACRAMAKFWNKMAERLETEAALNKEQP